ncbi:MAG TPA: hypothetical protein VHY34_04350 [Caulobacteraceae bacterium]|jgi:hypothetical protein|nr:hypothetical protein [Caulobacteraceae bacterium]
MRTVFIALVAGGAMAAAALPALSQSFDPSIAQREDRIGARIADGVDHADLMPNDASQLRSELRQIVDLDQRYQHEGVTDRQARDLKSRLSKLSLDLDYDLSIGRGPAVECEGYCFTP